MTIPKAAIEKAIEGGWPEGNQETPPDISRDDYLFKLALWQRYALDPTFWQALGKALGWNESDAQKYEMYKMSGGAGNMPVGMYMWHKKALRFYDLILTGGDTDKFWAEILQ